MTAPGHAQRRPFFLDTPDGQRFCLFHPPGAPCRGAVVYVHPFAEEMNRSRRMAALQARALAAQGVRRPADRPARLRRQQRRFRRRPLGRLAARPRLRRAWIANAWVAPPACGACAWARCSPSTMREGRIRRNACCCGNRSPTVPAYLTQFLRLRLAGELLAGGSDSGGTEALREALAAGERSRSPATTSPATGGRLDAARSARALARAARSTGSR
jgi:hypothetical protein